MNDGYFSLKENIKLKKDEFARYDVSGKKLYFRWTLFINKVLYMHYGFDGWVNQNILMNEYRKNGFKIYFEQNGDDFMHKPYMMIIFNKMEENNTTANFSVYVYDPTSSVKVGRE